MPVVPVNECNCYHCHMNVGHPRSHVKFNRKEDNLTEACTRCGHITPRTSEEYQEVVREEVVLREGI